MSEKTKKLEELPVVFLICVGRTGAGFLHSLLDSHKEILMVPAELKFYQMWDRLSCGKIDDAEEMVQIWSSQTKLRRLREGISYGYEEGKNTYTNCNFDRFRLSFKAGLQERGLSRRDVFVALHQAYADSIGKDMNEVKLIVEFTGYPLRLESALQDFPASRFLQVIRDYRGNYASLKEQYLNTRGGLFDWNGRGVLEKIAFIHLLNLLIGGTGKIAGFKKKICAGNFYLVRLEDLHTALEPTMKNLAAWLGVTFNSALLESTLGGKPWLGNSAFGEPVRGVSPGVLTRWKQALGASEILLIEYLFKEHMQEYGYQHIADCALLSRNRVILKCLFPLRDEFSLRISREMPARSSLKALWDISPRIIFFLRLMRGLLQIPVRLLFYPISRYYLIKLIIKKNAVTMRIPVASEEGIVIRGRKVFLRLLTEEDVYGRWWEWFNDGEVTKYLNKGQERNTVEKQMSFFRKVNDSGCDFVAGICDSANKRHIGTTGIHNIRKEDGKKVGNFGIIIGEKEYWGKGVGTEVWQLMTEYAFDTLALDRIETKIFPDNAASLRIARQTGFEEAKLLKNDVVKDGKKNDRMLLKLDKDAWRKIFRGKR